MSKILIAGIISGLAGSAVVANFAAKKHVNNWDEVPGAVAWRDRNRHEQSMGDLFYDPRKPYRPQDYLQKKRVRAKPSPAVAQQP